MKVGIRIWNVLVALSLVFSALAITAPAKPVEAANPLRISQIYGAGGNSGALLRNDYVELYNSGTTPIDLSGWSVQYASATGTSWSNMFVLSGTIQPGGYFLIQGAGGVNGDPIPTPDFTGTVNLSGSTGKLALVQSTTALTGTCPSDPAIMDFVGYGTSANCYEGTLAAPAPSTITSIIRGNGGCEDTDNNNLDFTAVTPAPRNSASPTHTCSVDLPPSVESTDPANDDVDVALDANITVTFSEPVTLTGAWYDITCDTSGTHTGTVDETGDPVIVINPALDFVIGDTCTVTVLASGVTDEDGVSTPMTSNYQWTFTTPLPDPAPTVTAVTPLNNATLVPLDSNLTVTFSEPVDVATGWYDITCALSGAHSAEVTGGPTDFTLNPNYDFVPGELCTVTLENTRVTDQDLLDPYDAMLADYTWSFTTNPCGAAHTLISAIQGSGASSPLVGQLVTVEGLVVADMQGATTGMNGFYIQSLASEVDDDPLTSEGLMVYSNTMAVSLGDVVRVQGTVTEYENLTELGTPSLSLVAVCSTGNLIPDPVALDLPDVATPGFTLEPYENMLVTFGETLTVQQNYFQGRYGQVTLGAGGRIAQMHNLTKDGGSLYEYTRMVILDDANSRQNPAPIPYYLEDDYMRTGDTITGVTGILDEGRTNSSSGSAFPYRYYRLQPTIIPDTFVRENPRPATPPDVGGRIKVVGANVLNYFTTLDMAPYRSTPPYDGGSNTPRGADTEIEFTRQEDKLVAMLAGLDADVLGLMEIESWDGAYAGEGAPQALVDALNLYLDPTGTTQAYAVIADPLLGHFDPLTDPESDFIQVALIYKVATMAPVGLALSVDDPIFDRSPFAQEFEEIATGEQFVVVANHFKSKGSCPDPADPDYDGNFDAGDGQGCWNLKRMQQAEALLGFAETDLAPLDPDILFVGDYNAYGAEDPIAVLTDGGLVNQVAAFVPEADRYSYVFDGTAGYLDHALSTASATSQITGVGFWHINADETSVIDYNTEFKTVDLYEPHQYRASDHDPVILGLNLNTAPEADPLTASTDEDVALNGTLTGSDFNEDPLTFEKVTDPTIGSVVVNADGTFTYTPNLDANGSDTFTFRVYDGALYSEAATVTITVNPINDAPVADDQDVETDEETPLDGTVTATDVEGDSLTYSGTGDTPYGAVVVNTDGTFTYTPDADFAGEDSFTFTVSDGFLTDTGVVTITVNPVNDAPVPPAIEDVEWLAREAHTYEVPPFTDPDGDELTYTAELYGGAPLPSWLVFDGQTRTFSGTPANIDAGPYVIIVFASDGTVVVPADSFTLTVVTNPFRIVLPIILR
ncbi:MAG TPA: ExeM/NucH family extracellular endonuclease [Anaerolineaceae bacterium]|nr:ExeM/NucH family extracellular endonuclease [Anaerolineaceae bacterium]